MIPLFLIEPFLDGLYSVWPTNRDQRDSSTLARFSVLIPSCFLEPTSGPEQLPDSQSA